ncbi:hypothetical protein V8E53_015611 [Lactarius tabidus]
MLPIRSPAPIKLESNWDPYARGVCLRGEHKHVPLFSDNSTCGPLVEALFAWQVQRHLKGFLDDLRERGDGDHTLRLIQYLAVITLSSIQVRPRHYGAPADRPTAALSALPAALVRGGRKTDERPPAPHLRLPNLVASALHDSGACKLQWWRFGGALACQNVSILDDAARTPILPPQAPVHPRPPLITVTYASPPPPEGARDAVWRSAPLVFRYRCCIPPVEGDREETKDGLVESVDRPSDRLETVTYTTARIQYYNPDPHFLSSRPSPSTGRVFYSCPGDSGK